MKTIVFCTTEFVAFHSWPEAYDQVAFLRNAHRHVFKVRLEMVVAHLDRAIEFLTVQSTLRNLCRAKYEGKTSTKSCEMFANEIGMWAQATYGHFYSVTVSEDGENGSTVYA